jgi:DNA invertase Pin-like site-specific DNA recombinase
LLLIVNTVTTLSGWPSLHFAAFILEVLDELNRRGIQYISFRDELDTSGPFGRAIVTIVAAVAELERLLIVERVRASMRRARLEGRSIGRPALALDCEAILGDRQHGQSLGQISRAHRTSRATVHRVIHGEIPHEQGV